MSNSVYKINKGINQPVEFRGLKAQYIGWLGGGLIVLLIVFAVMYISGLNPFVCVGVILTAGAVLFSRVYKMSHTHGEHGMMKKVARRRVPKVVKSYTRKLFFEKICDGKKTR